MWPLVENQMETGIRVDFMRGTIGHDCQNYGSRFLVEIC